MLPSPKDPRPLSILIVEDNAIMSQAICTMCGDQNKVYAAATLEEGWKLYLSQNPDLAFLDIHLPDGNGHELARRIKEHNSSCFIVMETGSGTEENIARAEGNHVNGFIAKPFNQQQVQDCIDLYISHNETK